MQFRMIAVGGLVVALAAGCAADLTGTPAGGVVKHARPDEALPLAQAHCSGFGKDARISGSERFGRGTTTFDCVPRS